MHVKKNIVVETIKQTEQFAVAERDMRLLTRVCKFILLFIVQEEKDEEEEEEETCSTSKRMSYIKCASVALDRQSQER